MENIPEHIIRLLLKYSEKTLSKENQDILNLWLQENPLHTEKVKQLQKLAKDYEEISIYQNIDTTKAWKKVEKQLPAVPGWKKKHLQANFLKVAAVILPLFIGSITFFYWQQKEQRILSEPAINQLTNATGSPKAILELSSGEKILLEEQNEKIILNKAGKIIGKDSAHILVCNDIQVSEKWNIIRTPIGGEYQLILSDGTKVWINSGSELRYPANFTGKHREVELKGEAFFEVSRDTNRPFTVHTSHSDIRVLGTSFNVSSYANDKAEHTTLVSGKVEVLCEQQTHILTPGKQFELLYQDKTSRIKEVDTQLFISWKEGLFRFVDMPLDELCMKLYRWYNVNFFFQNPKCKEVRFTGVIQKDININEFIQWIETTTNVKFKIGNNCVTIMEK